MTVINNNRMANLSSDVTEMLPIQLNLEYMTDLKRIEQTDEDEICFIDVVKRQVELRLKHV